MIDVFRSPAGINPVVIEALFPAQPDRLFDAWTRPDDLRKWFGQDPSQLAKIEIDLREGGAWRFEMVPGETSVEFLEGEYLKIRRAELLSFSWAHLVKNADGTSQKTPASKVTVTFSPMGASTKMRLEHSAIISNGGRIGVREGWTTSMKSLFALLMDAST